MALSHYCLFIRTMQLQKYEKDQIELYINVDTGESFASISGYARMVGKTKQAISARIEGDKTIELKTFQAPTTGGMQTIKLLPVAMLEAELQAQYTRTSKSRYLNRLKAIYQAQGKNCDKLDIIPLIPTLKYSGSGHDSKEKIIQRALARKYEGKCEVKTKFGYIDFLTNTHLYEIKKFTDYKTCLGQLLAYSEEYPDHMLIALFFDPPARFKSDQQKIETIVRLFKKYNITVKILYSQDLYQLIRVLST